MAPDVADHSGETRQTDPGTPEPPSPTAVGRAQQRQLLPWWGKLGLVFLAILLTAVVVAPIALSAQHLIGWAGDPHGLDLDAPWDLIVFLALDAAAALCIGFTIYCAWRGESAGVFAFLVWVFAGASAYANFRFSTRPNAADDAWWFFPLMSLLGAFLLEVVLKRLRKWVREESHQRLVAGVSFGLARWIPGVGALGDTYGAWRTAHLLGITDSRVAVAVYRALCPDGGLTVLKAVRVAEREHGVGENLLVAVIREASTAGYLVNTGLLTGQHKPVSYPALADRSASNDTSIAPLALTGQGELTEAPQAVIANDVPTLPHKTRPVSNPVNPEPRRAAPASTRVRLPWILVAVAFMLFALGQLHLVPQQLPPWVDFALSACGGLTMIALVVYLQRRPRSGHDESTAVRPGSTGDNKLLMPGQLTGQDELTGQPATTVQPTGDDNLVMVNKPGVVEEIDGVSSNDRHQTVLTGQQSVGAQIERVPVGDPGQTRNDLVGTGQAPVGLHDQGRDDEFDASTTRPVRMPSVVDLDDRRVPGRNGGDLTRAGSHFAGPHALAPDFATLTGQDELTDQHTGLTAQSADHEPTGQHDDVSLTNDDILTVVTTVAHKLRDEGDWVSRSDIGRIVEMAFPGATAPGSGRATRIKGLLDEGHPDHPKAQPRRRPGRDATIRAALKVPAVSSVQKPRS